MTIQVKAVESVRVIVESTFGADATSSPGLASFTYVPLNEGTAEVTLTRLEADPMFDVQSRMEGRENVLGARSADLKFQMNLAPTGTAAASGVAAVQGALGLLLKATMGGEHLGTGSTFVTGWTAITGDLTSAAGFLAGDFIGWSNTAGIVEWRQIKAISSNTVTLSHGFSGSPANTNVAYAAANYYVTEDPATSVQFLVSGQESDDRWLLTGGQCTTGIAINIDPSGAAIPTIDFNFHFSWFLESDETAASVTGTLADATYTNYSPIVGNAGEYRMFTVGTPTLSTSSLIHVSAETWAPKIEFTAVTSPSGANGGTVFRYRGSRINPPIEGSFTTFFEALTWFQARDARGDYCQQRTIGVAGGSAVILSAPTIQVVSPQRGASNDQIAGQVVPWKGRRNTDTAATTELAKSPQIIALG
jgi:hypothetical protein